MISTEIQDEILKSMEIMLKKDKDRAKNKKGSYHIEGKIVSINEDGKYTVKINGENETLPARGGLTLSVGEVVLICLVNGNESFKFIDLKRPNY